MDDRQHIPGGHRAGLRSRHSAAALERVRGRRERRDLMATPSSETGDRRCGQERADPRVDFTEGRGDPGQPPPDPRIRPPGRDDRPRVHAESEDPGRGLDRHGRVRRIDRKGQRRPQQAWLPQLVRFVRAASRQHGPDGSDRDGDLHVRLIEVALRALPEPGRRDDSADPRALPRCQQVSVRAMSLRRPATPLHDRPAPRRWIQIDPILLIVTLLLIGYGLVMTYSTTAETRTFTGDPMQFVVRGAIWAAVGLAAMAAVALFDYAWLGAFAPLLYVFTLGLLSVVLAIGTSSLGAHRAINLGGLSFQFSEVAKVLMIIVLAKFFADRCASIGSPLTMLLGLVLLAPAVFLVYRQPDLGTSLVFIAIFFGIAFLAGARIWQLVALVAIAAASFPIVWSLLKDYQRARLSAFLNPYADPQGAGWNIIQSLIAVGSGGATGKGLTAGTQSPLGYLPIAESDFVFSGLAEDLGFAGAVILFALYIVLLVAALRVAFRAKDPFGMLIGAGVATMLLCQIMVNVGMAISLMPVTGIPLPFISHGGSSLVSICFALGVLQSISMRREPEGP